MLRNSPNVIPSAARDLIKALLRKIPHFIRNDAPGRLAHFALITLLLLPLFSWGLSSDEKEPAHFEADDVSMNHKTGITVFTGHVKVDQGSTHLTADKLTVYKDQEGKVTKIVAAGQLAHYATLPDKQKMPMDAFAKTIEYYPKEKKAVLLGQGMITQGSNTFKGEHIIYNLAQQTVTSLPTAGSKSVLILQPQDMPS